MCFIHRFLGANLKQLPPDRLFVGLRLIEGNWKWIDGSPATNIPWYPGQPSGGEDCGEFLGEFGNYGVNDVPCRFQRGAICEVPL